MISNPPHDKVHTSPLALVVYPPLTPLHGSHATNRLVETKRKEKAAIEETKRKEKAAIAETKRKEKAATTETKRGRGWLTLEQLVKAQQLAAQAQPAAPQQLAAQAQPAAPQQLAAQAQPAAPQQLAAQAQSAAPQTLQGVIDLQQQRPLFGQQDSFKARFIAEEAARVEKGVAEQGERKKKEVAAKKKEGQAARKEKHKIRFMEEKQEVYALYAQAVRTTKLTVTNAQQNCALSLSLSKRVYNKHWPWKR